MAQKSSTDLFGDSFILPEQKTVEYVSKADLIQARP